MTTPNYILRFMAAVFPEAPKLALASFDEKHAIETATEIIVTLRAQRDELLAATSRCLAHFERIGVQQPKSHDTPMMAQCRTAIARCKP